MFPLKRSLMATAIMLTANLAPSEASARPDRPDAETHPSGSRKTLAVVQDGSGFSIRRTGDAVGTAPATQTGSDAVVTIGNALRVDRHIFAIAPRRSEDETHAQRR